jgi:hypothetical protein
MWGMSKYIKHNQINFCSGVGGCLIGGKKVLLHLRWAFPKTSCEFFPP